MATLSFVKLLLCAQSLWQTHRSGRGLGRVALPTVHRQHELSREGFPQYSLCPYGGIHWISSMNSTRQGNGSSSWTVREKRGGPGTTVKRKGKKKKCITTYMMKLRQRYDEICMQQTICSSEAAGIAGGERGVGSRYPINGHPIITAPPRFSYLPVL